MSLQEVFIINYFLLQAKKRERMTTATSVLTRLGPYMNQARLGLEHFILRLCKIFIIRVFNIKFGKPSVNPVGFKT